MSNKLSKNVLILEDRQTIDISVISVFITSNWLSAYLIRLQTFMIKKICQP